MKRTRFTPFALAIVAPVLLFVGLVTAVFTPTAHAAPLVTVTNLNDSGADSLRQAIADVDSGGTIEFSVSGTIVLASELVIDQDLTIAGGNVITVSGNNATRVFNVTTGNVTLDGLTIINGSASEEGGGIYNNGALTVNNSAIITNSATWDGGGIANFGTLTVTNSVLSDNSADWGGGISNNEGTVTVNNSVLSGNSANSGGGILNFFGTLMVTNSTLSGNLAVASGGSGGGIRSDNGTLTVTNSILSGNSANSGGGIAIFGGSTLTGNSTLSDNSASRGGGIWTNGGTLTVNNSTLSGNSATEEGGGIFSNTATGSCGDTPRTIIRNSTLSGNSADSGGGVWSFNDEYTCTRVGGTIIAGNSDNDVAANGTIQRFFSLGYNLIGTAGLNVNFGFEFNQTGDMSNTLPLLDALADNGGPTLTHTPQSGSPALDAGDNATCPAADQRGQLRTDYTCDIGAVELQFSDNDTVSKTVSQGNTYTFGPTLAKVEVVNDGGCLTGLTIQRVNSDHPQAVAEPNPRLQTGVYWDITGLGCNSGFTVTLTLPTPNFTPDASAKLCRYADSAWDCGEASENSASSATIFDGSSIDVIVRQEVNALSLWAAGDAVGPTAVTMASFTVNGGPALPGVLVVVFFLLLSVGLIWRYRF